MKGPLFVAAITFAGVSLASALPLDGGDRPERVGPTTQPASTQEAAAEQTAPRRDGPANAPDAEVESTPERTGPAVAEVPAQAAPARNRKHDLCQQDDRT